MQRRMYRSIQAHPWCSVVLDACELFQDLCFTRKCWEESQLPPWRSYYKWSPSVVFVVLKGVHCLQNDSEMIWHLVLIDYGSAPKWTWLLFPFVDSQQFEKTAAMRQPEIWRFHVHSADEEQPQKRLEGPMTIWDLSEIKRRYLLSQCLHMTERRWQYKLELFPVCHNDINLISTELFVCIETKRNMFTFIEFNVHSV